MSGDTFPRSEKEPFRHAIRPAVWIAIPFAIGVCAGLNDWCGNMFVLFLGAGTAITSAVLLHILKFPRGAMAFLLGAALFLGVLRADIWQSSMSIPSEMHQVFGEEVWITGEVVTDPTISGRRWRFGFRTDTIQTRTALLAGQTMIHARLDTAVGSVNYGTRAVLHGRLRSLPQKTTAGTFDYGAYLRRKGYTGSISVYDSTGLRIRGDNAVFSGRLLRATRAYIRRTISTSLDSAQSGLARGLLLGDKTGVGRKALNEFQSCGIMHILAVSGLHVGMVLGFCMFVFRFVPVSVWLRTGIPLVLIWLFAWITGGNPPVIRACIMATILTTAWMVNRNRDLWNALALSALVILLIHPADLLNPGFQLSYCAVAGIIAALNVLKQAGYTRQINAPRYRRILFRFSQIAIITLAAQLATAPLVAHHFYRIPLSGIIVGPFAVFAATLAVWSEMVALAFGWCIPIVSAVHVTTGFFLDCVYRLSEFGASLPLSSIRVQPPTWIEIVLTGVSVFTGFYFAYRRSIVHGITVAALLMSCVFACSSILRQREGIDIVFLDVGQGDATLCIAEDGTTVLIDGGRADEWFDAGDWVIVPYCRYRGIGRIDAVIATHADNDHVGGLTSVVEQLDVGMVLWNGRNVNTPPWTRLVWAAERRGVPMHVLHAGDSVVVSSSVKALVLSPPADTAGTRHWSRNDVSVVLSLAAGREQLLLTGDAALLSEMWMRCMWGDTLQCDILKAGHHGARSSTSVPFLETVRPQTAAISAGRDNRYGHPAPAVLKRLQERDVQVFRTDRNGTVVRHIEQDTAWWERSLPVRISEKLSDR